MKRRRKGPKVAECEMAMAAWAWLEKRGWDVYPEIMVGSGRADLVAVKGLGTEDPTVWIIEVKNTVSLELLNQALRREAYGHLTSVCVPSGMWGGGADIVVAQAKGLGVLEHCEWAGMFGNREFEHVGEHRAPVRHKPVFNSLQRVLGRLVPEAKAYKPGTNSGGYHTSYKGMIMRVEAFLLERGPSTIKEILEGVEAVNKHYAKSSASNSLRNALTNFETKRFEVLRGRPFRVKLKEDVSDGEDAGAKLVEGDLGGGDG